MVSRCVCSLYIRNERTRRQEHLVNALALRGEEGRSTLRKAAGDESDL